MIPQIAIPQYEIKLPSSNKNIKFRPFLVKENKILMLAAESNDIKNIYLAVSQILKNCILDSIDVDLLPAIDFQFLFFKIRAKSLGEISEFNVQCEKCNQKIATALNFDNVEIKKTIGHNKKIDFGNNTGLVMQYPSLECEQIMLDNSIPANEKEIEIILNCIDYFYDQDSIFAKSETTKEEIKQLIEELTMENYLKIKNFFDTMPKLSYTLNIKCKCGYEEKIIIENLRDFFG